MIAHTYYFECQGGEQATLNSHPRLVECLHAIASTNHLKVVAQAQHQFVPMGISIAFVLAESHLAIHSWPEEGSAYILLSSCRKLSQENVAATGKSIASMLGFTAVNARELT